MLFRKRSAEDKSQDPFTTQHAQPSADDRGVLLRRTQELSVINSQFDVDNIEEFMPRLSINGMTEQITELAKGMHDYYLSHNNPRDAGVIAVKYGLRGETVIAGPKLLYQQQIDAKDFRGAIATAEKNMLGEEMVKTAAASLYSVQVGSGTIDGLEDGLQTATNYLDENAINNTAAALYDSLLTNAESFITQSDPIRAADSLVRAARVASEFNQEQQMITAPAIRAFAILMNAAIERSVPGHHARSYDIAIADWPPQQDATSPFAYGFRTPEDKELAEQQHTMASDGGYDIIYKIGFTNALTALEKAKEIAEEFGLGNDKVSSALTLMREVAWALFNHQLQLVDYNMRNPVYVTGYIESVQEQGIVITPRVDFKFPSVSVYAAKAFADAAVETAHKYGFGEEQIKAAENTRSRANEALGAEMGKISAAQDALDMKLAKRGGKPWRVSAFGLHARTRTARERYRDRVDERGDYVYQER